MENMTDKEPKERMAIYLPKRLRRKLRLNAADQGISMSALISRLLEGKPASLSESTPSPETRN